MSAQTNPLVSILYEESSSLKAQESLHSTIYASLESALASEAIEVSIVTSELATNPSASQIYASLASKYSTFFLPATTSTVTSINNDTSTSSSTSTPSASSNPFSSTLPVATSATSLISTPATSLPAASSPIVVATSTADPSSGLSPGAKIGLGVGIGIGVPILALLSVLVFLMLRKRRKSDFNDTFPQAQQDHHVEEEPPRHSFQHEADLSDPKGKSGLLSHKTSSALSEKIQTMYRSSKPPPPPSYMHPGIPELDVPIPSPAASLRAVSLNTVSSPTVSSPTPLIPQRPVYELEADQ